MNVEVKTEDVIFWSLSYCPQNKDSQMQSRLFSGARLRWNYCSVAIVTVQSTEYRGIKFQCFGHRALTLRNQSLWERILGFPLGSRVYGGLSSRIQFPSVCLFKKGWLLFSLFLEQYSTLSQSLPTQRRYSHSAALFSYCFVINI